MPTKNKNGNLLFIVPYDDRSTLSEIRVLSHGYNCKVRETYSSGKYEILVIGPPETLKEIQRMLQQRKKPIGKYFPPDI